jgi:hypothetical protein
MLSSLYLHDGMSRGPAPTGKDLVDIQNLFLVLDSAVNSGDYHNMVVPGGCCRQQSLLGWKLVGRAGGHKLVGLWAAG